MDSKDKYRVQSAAFELHIDPALITRVERAFDKVITTPDGARIKPRWSGVCIDSGENLGYSKDTPDVLYWMQGAAH